MGNQWTKQSLQLIAFFVCFTVIFPIWIILFCLGGTDRLIDAVREHLKQLIDCAGLTDVMTLPGGPALAEHGLVAKALSLTAVLLTQAQAESLV